MKKVNIFLILISIVLLIFYGCPHNQSSSNSSNSNGNNNDSDSNPEDDSGNDPYDIPTRDEQVNYYEPPQIVSGTIYDIGPGYSYKEVSEFPWLSLREGDLVRIHYRSEPYRGIIGLGKDVQGTEESPVRIYGVRGSNGELPVLSGKNAVIGSSLESYFDQYKIGLGIIVICGTYRNNPNYIEIANLDIREANPKYSFIDASGNSINWESACGIWLKAGNTSILGCRITQNGQGIHTQANANFLDEISTNTLIEGSAIYYNGVKESDQVHNLYIQGAGMTVQFCYIGLLIPNASGSSLKDRSSGTIIRYNFIESNARTLDLVEPEDTQDILMPRDDFKETHVYGNIIINDDSTPNGAAANIVHYGYDNIPDYSRNGTLYFYNNTVYMNGKRSDMWRMSIFDVSLVTAKVKMYNNIFYMFGDTYLNIISNNGNIIALGGNWISDEWYIIREADTSPYGDGILTETVPFIEGSNPGFTDIALQDFTLLPNSPCRNIAETLPSELSEFPVQYQYEEGKIFSPRNSYNNSGALE